MKKMWIIGLFVMVILSGCIKVSNNASAVSEKEQVKTIVNFDMIEPKEFNKYFKEKHDDTYVLEDIIEYNRGNTDVLKEQSKNDISNNTLKKRMIILKFNL